MSLKFDPVDHGKGFWTLYSQEQFISVANSIWADIDGSSGIHSGIDESYTQLPNRYPVTVKFNVVGGASGDEPYYMHHTELDNAMLLDILGTRFNDPVRPQYESSTLRWDKVSDNQYVVYSTAALIGAGRHYVEERTINPQVIGNTELITDVWPKLATFDLQFDAQGICTGAKYSLTDLTTLQRRLKEHS